jgi:hypothetical protein
VTLDGPPTLFVQQSSLNDTVTAHIAGIKIEPYEQFLSVLGNYAKNLRDKEVVGNLLSSQSRSTFIVM